MQTSAAHERLDRVVAACGAPDAGSADLRAALKATTELRGFIDARRAELVQALREIPTEFAEAAIAETSGCSLSEATRETERAVTLSTTDAMADALSDGSITAAHVDVLTRAARNLDERATSQLLGDDDDLARAASRSTVAAFDALVKKKAKALDTRDAESTLDRQRRATRLQSWTDNDGMWNLRGRFDPKTGAAMARQIEGSKRSKFADSTPDTAPANSIERAQHLEALALADLVLGDGSSGTRPGPPLVVVDASQCDGSGGPVLDWRIPIELPRSVLADIFDTHEPDIVIVSNGVVLHAAGRLDLGRSSRLANRAQRRALAGSYSTCAVPGCSVHYDRCRLHHIVFWEHGGSTDLANLLPVCQHHHTRLHDDGWNVTLGPRRELTIQIPCGQVMRTGPPKRGAT